MWNAIGRVLTDSLASSHDHRVDIWLNNATKESVLESLTSTFFPRGKGKGIVHDEKPRIKNTFEAYGSIDEIQKVRYWYEKDFALFLSSQFSGPAFNASIPILWRSFHFYGYLPFSHNLQRLDYNAFRRAIALLAAGGDQRLGMDADGRSMDQGRALGKDSRTSRRLRLIFRSLSFQPVCASAQLEESQDKPSTAEDDVLDVLLLVMPWDHCIMTRHPEEVRPHAKRIASSIHHTDSSIPRKDFLNLLKLLVNIEMDPPKPFRYFQTAHTLPGADVKVLDRAADTLLRRFAPDQSSDIDWISFESALDIYLPKFAYQLRLVCSAFLSASSTVGQSLETSPSTANFPSPYAQVLSLCLHPSLADSGHNHAGLAYLEACFALQKTKAIYSALSSRFSTADLVATLLPIETATLLLITGEAITAEVASPSDHILSTRAIFGALVPTSWDMQHQRSCKASPSGDWHTYAPNHMLFSLEPQLEILRPSEGAWISDLITIIDTDAQRDTRGGLRFGAESANGLSVNFDSGIATLKSVNAPEDVNINSERDRKGKAESERGNSTYRDIAAEAGMQAREWVSSLKIRKLELYDLGGPRPESPSEKEVDERERRTAAEIQKLGTDERYNGAGFPQPRVGETELRKRIEGFGSSGRRVGG